MSDDRNRVIELERRCARLEKQVNALVALFEESEGKDSVIELLSELGMDPDVFANLDTMGGQDGR